MKLPRCEPLREQEMKTMLAKAEMLQNYPRSIRCFNELFEVAMNILSQKGKRLSWFPKRIGYYNFTGNVISPVVLYTKERPIEHITLVYGTKNKTAISLLKERGFLTRKRLEDMDEVTMVTRGMTPSEVLKGLRTYEPSVLVIEDAKNRFPRVVNYE